MPWTFAHPAAVLPLRRFCPRYLSFPALVVGSTMPDFGYYIPGAEFATHAHGFTGAIEVCLPLGLLVMSVLCLMRRSLVYLLPQPHRAALTPLADAPVQLSALMLLRVAVSLVLGACTHIIWDAFTHKRDLIGLHIEWLQSTAFHAGATAIPMYYVLQWLSTLAGTAILVVTYRRWLQRRRESALQDGAISEDRWRYLALKVITVAALIVAVSFAAEVAAQYTGAFAVAVLIRCVAVFGVMAFVMLAASCALFCCALRVSINKRV